MTADIRILNQAARKYRGKLREAPDGAFKALVQRRFEAGRALGMRTGYRDGYAAGATAVLGQFLRPGDIVLDCGANIGDVSAQLVASGATIHCFEPDPDSFAALASRLGDAANVTLHQSAVSTRAGKARFFRHDAFGEKTNASLATTMVSGNKAVNYDAAAFEADLIDLPAFIAQMQQDHGEIAVLKLDIEGAELDIIEAMLDRDLFDGIRVSLIETHENQFPDLAERTLALKARIADRYPEHKVCTEWK